MKKKTLFTVVVAVAAVATVGFFGLKDKTPTVPVSNNCPTTATGLCGDELLVFDWGGSDDAGLIPNYIANYPKPPRWSLFTHTFEALQKVQSGFQADIVHLTNSDFVYWQGLMRPWDVKKITHWNDMYSFWKKAPGLEPIDGKIYGIPTYFGFTGFAYDQNKIKKDEIKSLNELIDPKFKGRLTIPDIAGEAYALCYLATGKKIEYRKSTKKDIDDCKPFLQALHKNIRFYFTDSANVVAALKTGEIWGGFVWIDVPYTINLERRNAGINDENQLIYLDRKLGIALWAQAMALMNTSKTEVEPLAYEFVNAMNDQKGVDYLVNNWGYGSPNRKAMEAMDQKILKERFLDDLESYYKRGHALMYSAFERDVEEYSIKEFEKIKTGN